MYANVEEEMTARLRRIETRLSVLMEHMGVSPQVQRPERLHSGVISVPTKGTAMQEVLALMESGEGISVHCNGELLCLVTKCN